MSNVTKLALAAGFLPLLIMVTFLARNTQQTG